MQNIMVVMEKSGFIARSMVEQLKEQKTEFLPKENDLTILQKLTILISANFRKVLLPKEKVLRKKHILKPIQLLQKRLSFSFKSK